MDALGEGAGPADRAQHPDGRPASRPASTATSSTGWTPGTPRACSYYGMAFTVRAPTFITFDDWSLWDGAPEWNRVMNGAFDDRVALMNDPDVRERLQDEIDTRRGARARGLRLPGGPHRPRHRRRRATASRCSAGGSATWPRSGAAPSPTCCSTCRSRAAFQVEFKGDCMDIDPDHRRRDPSLALRRAGHLRRRSALPLHRAGRLPDGPARVGGARAAAASPTSRPTTCSAGCRPTWPGSPTAACCARAARPTSSSTTRPPSPGRPRWDQAERTYDWPANGWRWTQKAHGLHYTLVNGEVTFEGWECTGRHPGPVPRVRAGLTWTTRHRLPDPRRRRLRVRPHARRPTTSRRCRGSRPRATSTRTSSSSRWRRSVAAG